MFLWYIWGNSLFPHPSQNKIPYFFLADGPHSLPILHEIVWNLFTCREYFKILDKRGRFFFTIWFCLWSNIPFFIFELSYIFHTFENMKFPTFSWLFYPFPNPSWLCPQIPYLFRALKNLNLIPDFFKIFPTSGNPVYCKQEHNCTIKSILFNIFHCIFQNGPANFLTTPLWYQNSKTSVYFQRQRKLVKKIA